jgi:hypothetical protein
VFKFNGDFVRLIQKPIESQNEELVCTLFAEALKTLYPNYYLDPTIPNADPSRWHVQSTTEVDQDRKTFFAGLQKERQEQFVGMYRITGNTFYPGTIYVFKNEIYYTIEPSGPAQEQSILSPASR